MAVEFKDYFIIRPAIHLWDFVESKTYAGEQGKPVANDFEYGSNNNSRWIDVDQLRQVVS